jgi:hypothetical protein
MQVNSLSLNSRARVGDDRKVAADAQPLRLDRAQSQLFKTTRQQSTSPLRT